MSGSSPAAVPSRAAAGAPEPLRISTPDGLSLAGSLFRAPSPRGAVLIASALGVPRRLYAGFAAHLAEAGLTTLTFDYRGVCDSQPARLRGFEARLIDWAERDIPAALDALGAAEPGVPRLYFAHSVGGQLLGFVQRPPIDAALFVASQCGHWRLWDGWRRPAMWAFWHLVIPTLVPAVGYLPMKALGQGEDVPAGVAQEWARWGRARDYLLVGVRERGARGFVELDKPLRCYAIGDDGYAPPRSVEALADLYTGANGGRKDFRCIRPSDVGVTSIGHFGAFRSRFRETLWTEWREWLVSQV